jgi:hypothetical protein
MRGPVTGVVKEDVAGIRTRDDEIGVEGREFGG